MSKSNTFETDFLKIYFNGTTIANIADNTASAPATSLYVSLYTADPGDTASVANECAYVGYTRIAVLRTTGGWTVVSGVASPIATILFPTATGGSEIATHFGISRTAGGAPDYFGTVSPNIIISNGVTPQLLTGTSIAED